MLVSDRRRGVQLLELTEPLGYEMTPLGRELYTRFVPLVEWAERWAAATK